MACGGYVPDINGTTTCAQTIQANFGLLVFSVIVLFMPFIIIYVISNLINGWRPRGR